jgi:hypothetical protein
MKTFRKLETATMPGEDIWNRADIPLETWNTDHVMASVHIGAHTHDLVLRESNGVWQTFMQHSDGTESEKETHPSLQAAGKALSGLLRRHSKPLWSH